MISFTIPASTATAAAAPASSSSSSTSVYPFVPPRDRRNSALIAGVVADAKHFCDTSYKSKPMALPPVFTTAKKTWSKTCQRCKDVMPQYQTSEDAWFNHQIKAKRMESVDGGLYHSDGDKLDHLYCPACRYHIRFQDEQRRRMIDYLVCDRDSESVNCRKLAVDRMRMQMEYIGLTPTPKEEAIFHRFIQNEILPPAVVETKSSVVQKFAMTSRAIEARHKSLPRKPLKVKSLKPVKEVVEVTMSVDTQSPAPLILTFMEDLNRPKNKVEEDGSDLEPYTPPPIEKQNGYMVMKSPPNTPVKPLHVSFASSPTFVPMTLT
jgi:thiol-disulfide isomerase/thioredoxin